MLSPCSLSSVPFLQSLRATVPSPPSAVGARTHSDVIHLRMARAGTAGRGSDLVRMETVKEFNSLGLCKRREGQWVGRVGLEGEELKMHGASTQAL